MEEKKRTKKQVFSILNKKTFITKSTEDTISLGMDFSRILKSGDIVFLKGGLGSGKTTFVKGVAEGLGIRKIVRSSSFILVSEYRYKKGKMFHIDLYRLKQNSDFESLGLEEFLFNNGICLVEWADKIKKIPVKHGYEIDFKWLKDNKRKIVIQKRVNV